MEFDTYGERKYAAEHVATAARRSRAIFQLKRSMPHHTYHRHATVKRLRHWATVISGRLRAPLFGVQFDTQL